MVQVEPALSEVVRRASEWRSLQPLRTDSVPWRLWEKAKKSFWDPADIDFSEDAKQWKEMDEDAKLALSGLARGFMVGEEGVTLDILPLVLAVADEGRLEETIFLTSFSLEEAKHVDFFRRFFDAIGADLHELEELGDARMREGGIEPIDRDRTEGMFERVLPQAMRRVLTDRSPEAFLDASVTYNQFVEGCLANGGYKAWADLFNMLGVLPGLSEGLSWVRKDESRHITYGTFLCRRILAANPELIDFARNRMHELSDYYFGEELPDYTAETEKLGENSPLGPVSAHMISYFRRFASAQVDRRIQILEKAAGLSATEAELGTGSEEAEAELADLDVA
ncbi:MAG: R2-like ligand-binding oxidase [Acidimicrobiales bacterium]